MRILFAGIIARYPFGGVTWCSLMYLLGLRALGHDVFYIEDTGECVYDPVQNTRATDPSYGTTYIHNALEPFGLGDRWSFVNYDAHVSRPIGRSDVQAVCGGRGPVHQPVRRIVVLARRVRAHSSQSIHRFRSGLHPAGDRQGRALACGILQGFRSVVHLRREHRHAGVADSDRRLHVAQNLAADYDRRLARRRGSARSLHDRDDVADRELHRRRRQQGSGIRQVHRPAVTDAAALRARDQRAAAAAAPARLGHGRCDGGVADAASSIATSSSGRKPSSASPSTPTSRTAPAGSAIAPSVISPPAVRRWCRTRAGPLTCRPAKDCSRSRRRTKRSAGVDEDQRDYDRHARRAVEIAREHFDARASCRRLLETACSMRIAHIAPVATTIPPPKSGSVETMASLLTEGLVARGHDVTLFATGDSKTKATLHAIYPHGYWHDENMWPWELYEMLNLAAAVERARRRSTSFTTRPRTTRCRSPSARLSPTPIVQTLHHSPSAAEVKLWSRYPEAPFVAISNEQARLLSGLNIVSTVLHGIDTDAFTFREKPDDYLLFLGRFTEGKGVLQAIEIAKRVGMRLILAAAEDDYYREKVAPHVDGRYIRVLRGGRFRGQGEALRRRARAALSDSGPRTIRPRPRRGDGVRHAGRRPRSRRGARSRRRRRHRSRVRRTWSRWSTS